MHIPVMLVEALEALHMQPEFSAAACVEAITKRAFSLH